MKIKQARTLERENANTTDGCPHKSLSKERFERGEATGDYVCNVCGASGWGKNWPEREEVAI